MYKLTDCLLAHFIGDLGIIGDPKSEDFGLRSFIGFGARSSRIYIGQMTIAFSVSWPGPIIPKLRDLDTSPLPYLLTETQLSFVATLIYVGAILGPYITLWLSNTRGRKPCLIGGGIVSLLGYIIMATSKNLAMLYISRLFIGIAIGTLSVMNVVYIGEIASTNIRGILLTAFGISNTLGSLLLFFVGPFMTYHGVTYVAIVLNTIFVTFALFIPESPIFYVLQGDISKARKVLRDLGRLEDIDKLWKMKNDITNTGREWKELFTLRCNRKSLFLSVGINVFQQCSGILPVVFFSATIFEMAGSSLNSDISMIIIVCIQLTGCFVTPFFIERSGRKMILLFSCAICSSSMFLLGLYFYLDHIEDSIIEHIKWLPLVLLVFFFIGYDSGLGIIPNVLIGEMFTGNVRSKGSTVTMTLSWLFGFTVATAFGALFKVIGGHVAFWFFSCTAVLAFLFTVFFVPETRGKTLIEIQEFL